MWPYALPIMAWIALWPMLWTAVMPPMPTPGARDRDWKFTCGFVTMNAMNKFLVSLIACFAAGPLAAEDIMAPSEFEAFSAGTTLYFTKRGQPYGAEQYFEDRRVIWTFFNGQCERGAWFAEGDQICFVYETQNSAQCWHFLETDGEKRARVVGADPEEELTVEGQNTRDLTCPGPGVGVSYTRPLSEQ